MVNAIRVTLILSEIRLRSFCCHAADKEVLRKLYPMPNTRTVRAMGDDKRDGDFFLMTGAAASLLLLLSAADMILLLNRSDDEAAVLCLSGSL